MVHVVATAGRAWVAQHVQRHAGMPPCSSPSARCGWALANQIPQLHSRGVGPQPRSSGAVVVPSGCGVRHVAATVGAKRHGQVVVRLSRELDVLAAQAVAEEVGAVLACNVEPRTRRLVLLVVDATAGCIAHGMFDGRHCAATGCCRGEMSGV